MAAREALLSQGFPIDPALSFGQPCCSFATSPVSIDDDSDFSRGAQIGQAGNAMNCMVAAILMLYGITQVKQKELGVMSSSFEAFVKKFGSQYL